MKGRYWIAFWLLCFIIATGIVAVRTQQGFALASELGRLRDRRASLEAQKADLERRIRQATSRAVLGAVVAERLGLLPPVDTAVVVVCVPEPSRPCPEMR
jgi:hypothetical protein